MTIDTDPSLREAMEEFDANREAIDRAYEQVLHQRSGLDIPLEARLRGMFYSGAGFVILGHIRREAERTDVSQQIVDAIRAIGKAKP